MARFSYEELNDDITNASRNFGRAAARSARDFVCSVYRTLPGAIFPTPLTSITGGFARGLYDAMCEGSPGGLPAPPQPPFVGGQCPTRYNVTINTQAWGSDSGTQTCPAGPFTLTGIQAWGPIGGARVSNPGTLNFGWCSNKPGNFAVQLLCHGTGAGRNTTQQWVTVSSGSIPSFISASVGSVTRLDGLADNCGSLPSSYPPVVNPPASYSDDDTITYNDGTDFTIPFIYAPGADFGIPVTVNIGEIAINFDFSGAEINFGDAPGIDADILDGIENIQNDINNLNDTVNNFGDKLDKDDSQPGDPDLTPEPEPTGDETGEDFEDKILEWVTLDITQKPVNAKVQAGSGAPDVYYCGWFSFRTKGRQLPRQPIHYLLSVFKAPPGCDGYSYTVYEGFAATATAYTREVEPTGA